VISCYFSIIQAEPARGVRAIFYQLDASGVNTLEGFNKNCAATLSSLSVLSIHYSRLAENEIETRTP